MDKQTKQIFYIMLAFSCIWLVMSEFIGDKYITNALSLLFTSTSNTSA